MMKAKIVLDTSFGDGGKGLTVDNLCSQAVCANESVAVVRFSGGQQCGHTVIRGGIKHVFSSYGAGTMLGVPTYYTADTTMYLPNLQNEYLQLRAKGFNPELYLHPHTRVTTPYDVAYNRARERIMLNRHGSCGLGVGATMKRHDETPYRVVVADLTYTSVLRAKFAGISTFYQDKINDEPDLKPAYYSELRNQLDLYDYALSQMEKIPAFKIGCLKTPFENLIYEGSQGIMLDMDHGIFPNVTYAHTTSRNAISDLNRLGGVDDIEMYYVSRCYLTRHGRGWMPNEKNVTLVNTDEEINVYNSWQEDFRIGELDYDLINHAVDVDYGYHTKNYVRNLVLTCLDQRPDFKADLSKLKYFNSVYGNNSPLCGHTFKLSH